jgi:hypothetical protein
LLETVEGRLATLIEELTPEPAPVGRGRPRILPATLLWAGLVVCVLRGFTSQLALWRLLSVTGLWAYPRVPVSDQAIYRRLSHDGPGMLSALFAELTTLLLGTVPAERGVRLAPFAREVVVLDETTLDGVARTLPALREVPDGDRRLLPGKLAAVFDLRRQLFRQIMYLPNPSQNEKVAARPLLATVPPGSLVLADLGYFGFRWFDDLTDGGYHWVSRLRAGTSVTGVHTLYARGDVQEELVWLGAYRADRAKHLVRLVTIATGATPHRYLTNVTDPIRLPAAEVAALYARRWDIEQAVKLVKRDLGLYLLWSAKPAVVQAQVWAVLIIAQVLSAVRAELAEQAGCALDEVSLPLLIQTLPALAARGDVDPLAFLVAEGRRAGIIRPTRRRSYPVPAIPPDQVHSPPLDLPRTRPPRYAGRRCN